MAAALVAGLSGCGTISGTAKSASPDSQLADDVRSRLSDDPMTRGCIIIVSVVDGVVTLDGNMPSDDMRLRAKGVARGTEGVKGVVDNFFPHR